MQPAIADLSAAPWAILPNLLPVIRTALDDPFAYRQHPPRALRQCGALQSR